MRALKHLLTPHWVASRAFPPAALREIEKEIQASEQQHDGELRFAIESALPYAYLNKPARKRAEALFTQLRVSDTRHHNGVLVYVQLVDRRIEIVADHGIASRVEQNEWDAICREMQSAFSRNEFLPGSLQGIQKITGILARHFPPSGSRRNELPDKPVVL